MEKVQTTKAAEAKKSFNIKKIGAVIVTVVVIGATVYGFGFTTKGRTILRVVIEPAPAVNAYAAQDAVVEAAKAEFNSQIASPKAE